MAQCDKASDSQVREFETGRDEISAAARGWGTTEKKYLDAALDQLSVMRAFYSYGNGSLHIEENLEFSSTQWNQLVSAINKLTQEQLGITVSFQHFPDTLWCEVDMNQQQIVVDREEKIRIAKFGANKIFKVEFAARQRMSDEELVEVFDKTWQNGLHQWISAAEVIEPDEVSRRLLDQHQPFIDINEEHRTFRRNNAEYISQLQPLAQDTYKLTQFWRVKSSDEYPKTLFVNFDSVEEIDRFKALSQSLDIPPERLGIKLIRNFMDLHPQYSLNSDK